MIKRLTTFQVRKSPLKFLKGVSYLRDRGAVSSTEFETSALKFFMVTNLHHQLS